MPEKRDRDYSDRNEVREITREARDTFGLKFGRGRQSGVQANFIGIRTDQLSFSKRLDSRTYFIQDVRYGPDREAGVFRGLDREHIRVAKDLLKRLRIPAAEIATANVLKEQTQVGYIDRERKKVQIEEMQRGKSIVRLSRQIENLPVWSSGMVLGLAEGRRIGSLQLHWPEIPSHVIKEAHRLDFKVKHKWRPPEQSGAVVESVEAGIIHSPAIGLVMDIYPVIRVIYRDKQDRLGRKGVLYLDRNGKSVPIPRQAELPIESLQERRSPERKESG